jgi:hypothetical protein
MPFLLLKVVLLKLAYIPFRLQLLQRKINTERYLVVWIRIETAANTNGGVNIKPMFRRVFQRTHHVMKNVITILRMTRT